MSEKESVVVSYHCDTENDCNKVNNSFSADLYITQTYFYFPLSGIYTPAVSLKMELHTSHEPGKPHHYDISQVTQTCDCEAYVSISTTVGSVIPATLSFISKVKSLRV